MVRIACNSNEELRGVMLENSLSAQIKVIVLIVIILIAGGVYQYSFSHSGDEASSHNKAKAGEILYTHVVTESIGKIAIRMELPGESRYSDGAPIVVMASTWFVDKYDKEYAPFHLEHDPTVIGAISITHLWPGKTDPETKIHSEGMYDYGGPDSIKALRDTILFAAGKKPNIDGLYINDLSEITPFTSNLGLYASSHAGVVATNVLAYYADELSCVKYFVGRENPTRDEMYALEIGHFTDHRKPVENPYYEPEGYTGTEISVNYSSVGWTENDDYPEGIPYFQVEEGTDYVLSGHGPHMMEKRYFSRGLTNALYDNGVFSTETWPADLATPEETIEFWPYRITVNNYLPIGEHLPNLAIMLVFARDDHVQSAPDKPHIHQAYDGFNGTANLWVRMNADNVYFRALNGSIDQSFPENPANLEPKNWNDMRSWGYPAEYGSQFYSKTGSYAGIAEMADRTQDNQWVDDLDDVLYSFG